MNKELSQKPANELMVSAMSGDDVVRQVALVHDVMTKVMKKDEDYGIIPGGKKPSLWKPGSEKLCLTFRLAPSFQSVETYDGDHLTVKSTCQLTHIPTGRVMGSGEAICSTKEKKYRLRKDGGKIVPNNDLPDLYNTMIKMANKRSLIAATLVVTAASSMFTQDMGEEAEKPEEEPIKEAQATVKDVPATKEAPKKDKPVVKAPLVVTEKERGTWRGKLDHIEDLELPGGIPVWAIHCADGTEIKTDDKAFGESRDTIDLSKEYELSWKRNKKGTLILEGMKDAG